MRTRTRADGRHRPRAVRRGEPADPPVVERCEALMGCIVLRLDAQPAVLDPDEARTLAADLLTQAAAADGWRAEQK